MKEKINYNLVESYVSTFCGRYLTLKKLKTLTPRQCEFHFNNHWNILHFDNENVYHLYFNGGNGKTEKQFSCVAINEINNTVFVPWEDTFILFKFYNGELKPKHTLLTLRMLEPLSERHRFFANNGFTIKRRVLNLTNSNIVYDKINVF